jgi:GNAT superfamily N-acetyltransferase
MYAVSGIQTGLDPAAIAFMKYIPQIHIPSKMREQCITSGEIPSEQVIETAERQAWRAFYLRARKSAMGMLQPHMKMTSTGAMCSVWGLDILAYNRVLGAGMERTITARFLRDAIQFYRGQSIDRFFLPIAPSLLNDPLRCDLESAGYHPYNRWAILYRSSTAKTAYHQRSGLRVRTATHGDGPLFAELMTKSFVWTDEVGALLATMVGNPEFHIYFAEKNARAIGAAVLHIQGECGTMMLAGTLPEYRGLGAQSVLLQTRIHEAKAAGCTWLFSQTAEQLPQKPVQSYRNMLKAGFALAYHRTNFIYEINSQIE